MPIYACMGLAVMIIAGIVYMSFGGEKQIMVTMDDVDDGKPKVSKKAKVKKHPNAEAEKKAAAEEEWEDDPYEKDDLCKRVDESGPYPKSLQGTIEGPAFVKLRKVIVEHAYRCFMDQKEELMKERIEHLKKNDMKKYAQCVGKAAE